MSAVEKVQSADGTQIAVDRTGAGLALVLVVGAFNDRSSKNALASLLASTFTVYQYDRRGRGDSNEAGPYAIQHEVEDLAAVIRSAGGSASVYGHSSGGALALEAAASGVSINALTVYEVPYTQRPLRAFAEELVAMDAAGQKSEAVEAFLRLMGTPDQAIDHMKAGPGQARVLEGQTHAVADDVLVPILKEALAPAVRPGS